MKHTTACLAAGLAALLALPYAAAQTTPRARKPAAAAPVSPAASAAIAAAEPAPAAASGVGNDRAELDRTQIIGNRELPKVLYIVPWKKPLPGELAGKPVASVLDEVLAPVDRDVFRRQVSYELQLVPRATPASPSSARP
jgi:hypothetical protein